MPDQANPAPIQEAMNSIAHRLDRQLKASMAKSGVWQFFLVVREGGYGSKGVITKTAELYDAATKTFKPLSSMTYARSKHTSTLLSSGEVLIVGGRDEAGVLREAEVFHP